MLYDLLIVGGIALAGIILILLFIWFFVFGRSFSAIVLAVIGIFYNDQDKFDEDAPSNPTMSSHFRRSSPIRRQTSRLTCSYRMSMWKNRWPPRGKHRRRCVFLGPSSLSDRKLDHHRKVTAVS